MPELMVATRRLVACALAVVLAAVAPLPARAGGTPFTDIGGSSFVFEIEWLYHSGITAGCAPDRFCPTAPVTRGQMASFLARALRLPSTTTDYFTDDNGTTHEPNINRLAESGITKGCAPTLYCPTANVTRAQMASFLVRAFALPATPPATPDAFTDDNGTTHEADINRLAYSGITKGCSATLYCPTSSVTREQMAAFLYRSFHNPNSCDLGLTSNALDPLDSAKALGLCAREGLTAAAWTLPDGADLPVKPGSYDIGHSLRPSFGSLIVPVEGATLLVLSSGAAAGEGQTNPAYAEDSNKGYSSSLPIGFPLEQEHVSAGGTQACPDLAAQGNDGIGLRLEVTVPPGATAFSIDWKYYSLDYPDYICSQYVDASAILVDGANVMELAGRTVTANTVIDVCESGPTGASGPTSGTHLCSFGPGELAGTGFDKPDVPGRIHGGASTWQTTTVPVTAGQTYTIVLTIWDTSDGTLKSTVLFDNFRWVD